MSKVAIGKGFFRFGAKEEDEKRARHREPRLVDRTIQDD
jgi:hypothetical protein